MLILNLIIYLDLTKVRLEIRIVNNNIGKKLSILSRVISRLD